MDVRSMMTLMTWLLVLTVGSLVSALILTVVLAYRTQTRWMRIFSDKQGVPINILEGKPEDKPEPVVVRPKHKISVPIPGGEQFRKPQ